MTSPATKRYRVWAEDGDYPDDDYEAPEIKGNCGLCGRALAEAVETGEGVIGGVCRGCHELHADDSLYETADTGDGDG